MMESFKNCFEVVLGSLRSIYYPKSVNFLFFLIYGINNTVIMKKSSTLRFLESVSSDLKCCFLSKRKFTKLNFFKFNVSTVLPFIFMAIAMTSFTLTAQNIPGTVTVLVPNGGFGIDGDAYCNTPTPNIGDWFVCTSPSPHPGTGGGLFNPDGSIIDPTRTFFLQDDWGTFDATTFTTSNKIDMNPNVYEWGPSNNLLAKDDMQNVGAHFAFTGPNETGDLWCIFAADRQVVNGDAYIDFEFLQKPLTIMGAIYDSNGKIIGGEGGFESEGTEGGRTVNDLLVTLIFTNGGTSAEVQIRVWELTAKGYEYVLHQNTEFFDSIFATNNPEITKVPFDVYGTTPGVYAPNQWAEGAVNLTKLLKFADNPCATIATLFVRTKTSQSPSAELKDFPGIFQLNLSLDDLAIECPPVKVVEPCLSYSELESEYNIWASKFKYTGGIDPIVTNIGNLPVFDTTLYDRLKCGGTVEFTYLVDDFCWLPKTCTSTFTVTAPTAIGYTNPVNADKNSCDFADQKAVDTAFTDWIAAQTLALEGSITGGCDPQVSNGGGTAPVLCNGGTATVTWTITDLCETIRTITADFKLTAPDPLVVSNVTDCLIPGCTYGTQEDLDAAFALWLEGFTVSGGCDSQGVFAGTYTAPDRAAGGFVDVVYNVTDLCESGSDTARYTVEPCVNAHCTYTQGYYGNIDGMSCADGVQYTTTALIQKALESYPLGKMIIGLPGHSVWMQSTEDIDDIIRVLPGGGSNYVLPAFDKKLSDITAPSTYLRKGNLNNTLLAQTITLGLNLGIDGTLADFGLQAGILATTEPDGGCGTQTPKYRSCGEENYGILYDYEYFTIPAVVDLLPNKTVKGLFDLANTALGGGTLPDGVTLTDLANAVDVINNAFDGCRIAMGYNLEPIGCIMTSPEEFVAFEVPIVNNQLTIKYKFAYVSDVTIDVFNITGNKVYSKMDTNSYLDKEVVLNYKFNTGTQQVYIIRVTTKLGHNEQKVMSSPY